jgi:uncharacterized protein (TIGR03084 family)
MDQATHFRDECGSLHALLTDLPDATWEAPTQFRGWSINDVLGHLHLFDYAARITLDSAEELRRFFAQMRAGRGAGRTLRDFTREWLGDCSGAALRDRWLASAQDLAALYAAQDPSRRVAWGGPDMSVRSCISARQMETWAHGQAVFDLLGIERIEHDRLRNVAVMGVNTFGWTFVNRGLPVPAAKPQLRLTAPSGAIWEWNAADGDERIDGSAVEFCRVVTQTRNVADTSLQVSGAVARQWMSLAQCFAGPPQDPPPPGTRFRRDPRG